MAASAATTVGSVPFAPMYDRDTLPLPLDQALASGAWARVPLLIGTNRDEINLFLGEALKKLDEPIADAELMSQLSGLVPDAGDDRLRALLEVYRRSRTTRQLPHSERALLAAISSDALWRIPSGRFADACRLHQPATFQYLFTYGSPAMRGALGSCHALELPFVFGTLNAPGQAAFAGTGEAVQRLSERMMDSWLAFTRSGNPSVAGADRIWPTYDLERRPTMVFNLQSKLEHAPYEDERAAWDDLTPRPLD
jgi:para-nitrobenzyl esterase